MIKAEIIADSVNPAGKRLTTWILEYPRFVHAELMTHRMLSKNAASSRAIPIEKMIEQVIQNPAMPVWWGKNQSGMQAKQELKGWRLVLAKALWSGAKYLSIASAYTMFKLGLHKQIANRILEPWFNIRIIMSATEMENFFALRAHPDAQPEIQALAYKMLEAYNTSTPKQLKVGEWHIPFGDNINEERLIRDTLVNTLGPDWWNRYDGDVEMQNAKIKIAIARCARISYFNFEGKDDYAADIKLCDRLFGSVPRHLSPTEHVAQATDNGDFVGNFAGFKQYRYLFKDQNAKDPRVIKK